MMDGIMTNRKMTLYIEIMNKEEAKWIWDAHATATQYGIRIWTISDGDIHKERDKAIELIHDLNDGMNIKICDFLESIGEL